MNKENVIELMRSSKNIEDWDVNCEVIRNMNNGKYPDYWYEEIIASGLQNEIIKKSFPFLKSTKKVNKN